MGWVGLTCFKDGVRQIPVESIPGLQESGWKPSIDKVKVSVYWGGGGGVGLTCFKDGVRQIPVESIHGLQESGWKPPIDKV